jgi:hypothetical protein
MTLQTFCHEYGFPFSTVARHLRAAASDSTGRALDPACDMLNDYGVEVECDEWLDRFGYSVVEPCQLARKLVRDHGVNSPKLIAAAVRGACDLLDLIHGRIDGIRITAGFGSEASWDPDFLSALGRVEDVLGPDA